MSSPSEQCSSLANHRASHNRSSAPICNTALDDVIAKHQDELTSISTQSGAKLYTPVDPNTPCTRVAGRIAKDDEVRRRTLSGKNTKLAAVIIVLATLRGVQAGQGLCWAPAAGQAAKKQPPHKKVNGAGDGAEKLIKNSDCAFCHAVDRQLVGPSYSAIAQKYAGQAGVEDSLMKKINYGGAGAWGEVPMTPHSDLSDAKRKAMVRRVLAQKAASAQAQGVGKTYEYKDKGGKPVRLEFPVFVKGSDEKVTKDIFKGYELYNSYCYRCHGQDATESELAPDLKRSLNQGMDEQQFLSTAMVGKEDKGMPAWAGFSASKKSSRFTCT